MEIFENNLPSPSPQLPHLSLCVITPLFTLTTLLEFLSLISHHPSHAPHLSLAHSSCNPSIYCHLPLSASRYLPTVCHSAGAAWTGDHITTCARGSGCVSQDLPHLPHVPARFLSICSSQDLSPRYLTLLSRTLPQVPA